MADQALPPAALLERIARSLKMEIGPAVNDAYPKTQAFLASVVLEKLAGQLRLQDAHAADNRNDTEALSRELLDRCTADTPAPVLQALAQVARDCDTRSLTELVEVLYSTREALGEEEFSSLLARVRSVLRARVDRAMEYSA